MHITTIINHLSSLMIVRLSITLTRVDGAVRENQESRSEKVKFGQVGNSILQASQH